MLMITMTYILYICIFVNLMMHQFTFIIHSHYDCAPSIIMFKIESIEINKSLTCNKQIFSAIILNEF